MTDVRLKEVSKRFGSFQVCHNIDLDIKAGEFITLLGSSGCGKTTTLNMVAGLEDSTSGDILIGGRRVNDLSPVERDVAMVFQNYALYPHMTVAQNIGFTLKMRGVAASVIREKVQKLAASLELDHVLERFPAQLSGGQQQRVAIGRALIREPRIFLFDEPFSNLDASLRVKMRTEVKQLHVQQNVTSIFVTHDQEEAMSISDRIAVMYRGRVEQFGTPEEIYARPATRYVASFIGSPQIELLDGVLAEANGSMFIRSGEQTLPVNVAPRNFKVGRPVEFGVRPEHVRLGETGLEGRVHMLQPVGPATHVNIDTAAGKFTASVPGFLQAKTGDAVKIDIQAPHVHVFDKETGVRL
ncbi:multiple sugar transport system ATP-binding protein [Rhizobium mesoamericanum]|uniref:ABC transporter ATP-binding protein n=1 Tax=Rhizobium mesoamericanum TaxID=1079800 RepID=UPI002789A61B|nr:sn-glycerol-3-phosphate ABC transporter ATP-binding protein UgpC [Rhizobium mesoamericanum]MDQ0562284.1 multiple sugar transport system ATP-binding protein [Rhizobium mesoamericanum]